MIGVTVVAMVMMRDAALSRLEGILLFAGLIAYIVATFRLSAREDAAMEEEASAELPKPGRSAALEVVMIVGGLVALVTGADWFVRGAVDLARWFGLTEAVIGLTIVAAGTSLPELATSVVASFRRHTDIAIGNVVGSNIFNILAILGLTGIIHPFSTQNILAFDAWSMLFFAMLLLPLAVTGCVLKRWEGAVLLLGYIGYVAYRLTL
jgi:cation:H+ antiporter